MKVMRTTTTTLNTREFNKLSDKIIGSLYELNPDIQDLYDVHINYIGDDWRIDFIPLVDNIPVINVDTYTDYNDRDQEILRVSPQDLTDLPNMLKLKDDDGAYDLCMNYVTVFEFLLSLYDFEYVL